ncbi:unnamed protein product [Echinostoma caproni]|uniref:C2 domain-containing protein n=1 Tax=Echinostoma caproni TaxID=27848 RepID=A0A183ARY0_9TREM|nr:unnamed protein product [Echinostoma caproni]
MNNTIISQPPQPSPPPPPKPEPPVPKPTDVPKDAKSEGVMALKKRSQEYKLAAIQARDSGNLERAKALLQASKIIDEVIPKVESGEEAFCAETDLPPPPSQFETDGAEEKPEQSSHPAGAQIPIPAAATSQFVTVDNIRARLEYYKAALADAQTRPSEGNRQRRLTRIITQYKEGLKACEHGITSFDYGELPPPPRCPRLVGLPTSSHPHASAGTGANASRGTGSSSDPSTKRSEQVVALLKKRQNELKALALKAKQEGNMDAARNFLRSALSINPMIESAQAGLMVDLSKVPRLPTSSSASGGSHSTAPIGPILSGTKCDPPAQFVLDMETATTATERQHVLVSLMEKQVEEASKVARSLNDSGWSERAAKMTELAALCKSSLAYCRRPNVPYVFEWADLPSLNMNADLSDGVLEVTAVRGFAYPLPPKFTSASQVDTYVEIVLSYPTVERAQKFSTPWAKHSLEPMYESSTKFEVDIKSRTYARFVQSEREVKATVYYNAGVLKGSRPLGTASFPLRELSNSATINPVADLMDGRRAVGGRLMLRIRQRTPLSVRSVSYFFKFNTYIYIYIHTRLMPDCAPYKPWYSNHYKKETRSIIYMRIEYRQVAQAEAGEFS